MIGSCNKASKSAISANYSCKCANMEWDDLRFFLAVAETRSLLGGARKLGVNHSTVFRRINRFEESVGARLFERLPDGYHLTQAGEELLEHASRVGEEIDLLNLKILGKDFRPSGTIRITAPENLANNYLPRYLLDFSQRYPDIDIELSVGPEKLDLTRREADLAIRATADPPPHLIGRKVLALNWAFYASREYLQSRGTPTDQAGLTGHRLIGVDGPLQRLFVYRRLVDEFSGQIAIKCSTLNSMAAMASAGYGIALLPDDQVCSPIVRLFSVTPSFKSEIWLLTHPELRRTERIRLAMDHLFESFRTDKVLKNVAIF